MKPYYLKWASISAALSVLTLLLFTGHGLAAGCTASECHQGISDIVPPRLPMMQLIRQNGQRHGDPDGCIICHGGNPRARKKEKAHRSVPRSLSRTTGPKAFYPDPGSVWIADNTCGACHVGYVYRLRRSLMATEAGKIQGNFSTWGIRQIPGFDKAFGNYAVADTDGPVPSGTFPAYKTYMAGMKNKFPRQFPDRLDPLPGADPDAAETAPEMAGITYQRRECQRCHIGVRGKQQTGDFRGMGCSACHLPYATDGLYRGKDVTIPRQEPGHIRIHRIAGNRKTGGIPTATCNTCHNRGKRIGVSFAGSMETGTKGNQPDLHGKAYLQVSPDLHHRPGTAPSTAPADAGQASGDQAGKGRTGLLCQDCHTSIDIHGDGNLTTTTLGQVEIECTDCHGTPARFPWELPLGYGDEFGREPVDSAPRGVSAHRLLSQQQFGFDYSPGDGFLLSARGNPLGNVVRSGNEVIVHSAAGHDVRAPQLKTVHAGSRWKSVAGRTAMTAVSRHMDRLECYGCHSAWAPQCYGCHVEVDYEKGSGVDWVASGSQRNDAGQTAESVGKPEMTPGSIRESTGYRRWEDPILGINGEGRVSPLIPGCQVVYTVIGREGARLAENRTAENPAEAGDIGQARVPLALDMAPVQPHTTHARARSCESCHTNPKTAGFGIGDGRFNTAPDLGFDWSRIVEASGTQLVTVGSHWPASRAFNARELEHFDRTGTCIACHQHMDRPDIWNRVSTEGTLDKKGHAERLRQLLEGGNGEKP